ncbi:hypothetical protein [Pilimelia columellifera]|uniref:hypothetical protein n=1 Tax=Pilimelia columellifera TaxID=706574 RepID=UPI0031D526F8
MTGPEAPQKRPAEIVIGVDIEYRQGRESPGAARKIQKRRTEDLVLWLSVV